MFMSQLEDAKRKLIRDQAIERALLKHLRKLIAEGCVEVVVNTTFCGELKVSITTEHNVQPISNLTAMVQQVLGGTKIKLLRAKLAAVSAEQLYMVDRSTL